MEILYKIWFFSSYLSIDYPKAYNFVLLWLLIIYGLLNKKFPGFANISLLFLFSFISMNVFFLIGHLIFLFTIVLFIIEILSTIKKRKKGGDNAK